MTRTRFVLLCSATICMTLAVAGVQAFGQGLGPEAYGIGAYFGMGTLTSTRQLGMGTPTASVNDVYFGNPAFAATQETASAGVRVTTTDFEGGPRFTGVQAHYVQPLRPGYSGMQVSILSLDSSGDNATLPGMGPVAVGVVEDGFLVDYGQQIGDGLSAGLSVLGYRRSKFSLATPGGPQLVNLKSAADYGGRIGLAYEWAPRRCDDGGSGEHGLP